MDRLVGGDSQLKFFTKESHERLDNMGGLCCGLRKAGRFALCIVAGGRSDTQPKHCDGGYRGNLCFRSFRENKVQVFEPWGWVGSPTNNLAEIKAQFLRSNSVAKERHCYATL